MKTLKKNSFVIFKKKQVRNNFYLLVLIDFNTHRFKINILCQKKFNTIFLGRYFFIKVINDTNAFFL